ncbi:MAG: hypothetical protein JNK66_09510 [Chitinophagales bacterium]|nr:hypothetical protein [Chitinophagales bacterium]
METNPQTPPQPSTTTGKFVKPVLLILLLITVIAGIFVWQPFTKKTEPVPFQRDEKTKEQILQDDYREKVIDMLEDDMTVGEISKQTGLRKDVIRKIKKEHEEETE